MSYAATYLKTLCKPDSYQKDKKAARDYKSSIVAAETINNNPKPIGLLSFDDDDESYAQMLHIQKYLNQTNQHSIIDDMSVLRLQYKSKFTKVKG